MVGEGDFGNDMEETGYALIWGTIMLFVWRDWEKIWKVSEYRLSG